MTCSKCSEMTESPLKRYCNSCHAAYMREWRKTNRLSGLARAKATTRAHSRIYVMRGKLKPQPCQTCGTTANLQRHHPDYSKPLEIQWLCKKHHLELHGIVARV